MARGPDQANSSDVLASALPEARAAGSRRALWVGVAASIGAHALGAAGWWAWDGRPSAGADEALESTRLTLTLSDATNRVVAPVPPPSAAPAAGPPARAPTEAAPSEMPSGDGPGSGGPGPAPTPAAPDGGPVSADRASGGADAPGVVADLTAALRADEDQPGVSFAGLSASGRRARSVVYVVDASGPMVTSWPWVVSEVQRSVEALLPTQRFGVVLFHGGSEGGAVSVFDRALVDASPRQRRRLAQWLGEQRPGGRSLPLEGLRTALALRPQVVFVLSRSIERSGGGQWGQGLGATLDELDRLNPVDPGTGLRPVLIKTIQFLEPDPTGIMQAIGHVHGGAPEGAAGSGGALMGAGAGARVLERSELPAP